MKLNVILLAVAGTLTTFPPLLSSDTTINY